MASLKEGPFDDEISNFTEDIDSMYALNETNSTRFDKSNLLFGTKIRLLKLFPN